MDLHAVEVNGRATPLGDIAVHTTALEWLRSRGLTGCKEGCAEGECGACSILVARPSGDGATEWTALNACLVPVAGLVGQEIVTAEGLGSSRDLHPVQRELAVRGGSQCGYCTPGFVCSMAAEYYRPDRAALKGSGDHEHGPNGFDLHSLSGNLCRCTGYRPIRDAAFALGTPPPEDRLAQRLLAPAPVPVPVRISDGAAEFVRPGDLHQALTLLAEHPDAVVVAGSTDSGVEVNLRGARPAITLAVEQLAELRQFEVADTHVVIGAALSLSEAERLLEGRVPILDELFPQFASRLIRNSATLGGNLGTASPIGDAPPALLALDAALVLTSLEGDRDVPLAEFFTGYRETRLRAGELVKAVRIPLPLARVAAFHKIAKRRFDDISGVAMGFALDIEAGVVRRARIGLGGVAATPIRALATEAALVDQPWNEDTVRRAAAVMAAEGTPMDDHRASAAYRSAMLGQALLKFFATHQEVTV